MDWIRGGKWQAYADDEGMWLATVHRSIPHQSVFQADAHWFFTDLVRWKAEIGVEFGLSVYQPSGADLMDASEFAAEFQEPFSVDPFADYLPPEPNPIPDLLDFLEKFGPLGEVAAIVNLVPRWERPPGLDLPPATVNLHLLFLELQEVARRYSEAIEFRNGKQARPKWAFRLRDFGSEYRTIPRYLNDRIILEAIPRTLGARLQTWLLSLVVTRPTDTICRFCEHQFIVPLQRGRPAQYCARHKAPKFRKSWQRRTEVRYREAHPDECLGDTDHVAPGAGSEATVRALARQARR